MPDIVLQLGDSLELCKSWDTPVVIVVDGLKERGIPLFEIWEIDIQTDALHAVKHTLEQIKIRVPNVIEQAI